MSSLGYGGDIVVMGYLGRRWDMRLTDRQILGVIADLKQPATQREIAHLADCSPTTVKRAVQRLIKHKMLNVSGGRRTPYTYRICFDALPDDVRSFLNRG